jgi:hypothetical protein
MRAFAVLLLCIAGCASQERRDQYDRDMADLHRDDMASGAAWANATGGGASFSQSSFPQPKEPGMKISFGGK